MYGGEQFSVSVGLSVHLWFCPALASPLISLQVSECECGHALVPPALQVCECGTQLSAPMVTTHLSTFRFPLPSLELRPFAM